MKAAARLAMTGALAAGAFVAINDAPASATVVTMVSGTTITVTATGDQTVSFACANSKVTVNAATVTPNLACSALTKVTVNGDSARQSVFGDSLDSPLFSAHPNLVTSLGAGTDLVLDTKQAYTIATGPGQDTVYLSRGTTNTSVDLGADEDGVVFRGEVTAETLALASISANATIVSTISGSSKSQGFGNNERVSIQSGDGDDTMTTTGVTLASTLTVIDLQGGDGNDHMTGGSKAIFMYGGPGTNTFTGGAGNDVIISASATDSIDAGAGANTYYDRESGHIGRPGLVDSGTGNTYNIGYGTTDSVTRIRWMSAGSSIRITASLARFGLIDLPSSFTRTGVDLDEYPSIDARGLIDVVTVPGSDGSSYRGDAFANDLLDITVPTGTWNQNGSAASGSVDPNDAYGTIFYSQMGAVSVHGPWTSASRGFGHRLIRDLLFRFATAGELNAIEADLDNGIKTRAEIVQSLMDTDECRGLDVDRVFVKFLRRTSDPGGRTYWINSLENGKSLQQFRAQLFGSNEYFNKAGGTNAAYMERAYADVMGRAPDAAGKAFWVKKLDNGTDRGVVAREFLKSTEARRNLVRDQFLRFLDRYPITAELDTWIPKLAETHGEQDLIAYLTGSNSYLLRT